MRRLFVGGAVAALGLLGACSAEVDGDGALIGSRTQAIDGCHDPGGVNSLRAALAVNLATELGSVDPVRWLEKDCSLAGCPLGLTAEAQAICDAADGCPLTLSILAFQDDALRDTVPQDILNPTTFREELKAGLQRQKDHEFNLSLNHPERLPPEHSLSFTAIEDTSLCGLHYVYTASFPDCVGQSCTDNLEERMVFFGGSNNPFLDFQVDGNEIRIDPGPSLTGPDM